MGAQPPIQNRGGGRVKINNVFLFFWNAAVISFSFHLLYNFLIMKKGLLHIYTGEGKGKTTASVGLSVRARSRGLRVLFSQFMKQREGGEHEKLKELGIEVMRFVDILSPVFHPDADIKEQRKNTRRALKEIASRMGDFDLIVMDEFLNLVKQGLINDKEALEFLNSRPEGLELVVTGRGASPKLIDAADYVTEMRLLKHPFRSGVRARKGIEY